MIRTQKVLVVVDMCVSINKKILILLIKIYEKFILILLKFIHGLYLLSF